MRAFFSCGAVLLLIFATADRAQADDAHTRGEKLLEAQAGFQQARLGRQLLGTYMGKLYLGFVESTVKETKIQGVSAYAITSVAVMKLGTDVDNRLDWEWVTAADLRPVTLKGIETTAGGRKPTTTTTVTLRRVKGGWDHFAQTTTKGSAHQNKTRHIGEQRLILSPIELTFPSVLLGLTPGEPVKVRALHAKSGDVRPETWLRLPKEKRKLPSGELELVPVRIDRPDSEGKVDSSTAYLHPRTGKLLELAMDRGLASLFAIEPGQKGQNLP